VGDEGSLWFSESGRLERISTSPSLSDSFTGQASQSVLNLTGTPVGDSFKVTVGGTTVGATGYSLNGKALTLLSAPAVGASVTVTYSIANSGAGGDDKMVVSTSPASVASNLIGGWGNDTLIGGAKSDVLLGDDGEVVVSAGLVPLSLLSVAGSGNDTLTGKGGNDRMIGGAGNDTMLASSGADVLIGDYGLIRFDAMGGILAVVGNDGTGGDTISGVAGNDFIIAGGGKDTVSASGSRSVVIGDAGEISFMGSTLPPPTLTSIQSTGFLSADAVASAWRSGQSNAGSPSSATDNNSNTDYLAYGLGSTSGLQNNNGLIVSLVKPAAATSLTLTTSKTGDSRMIPSSFRVYGTDGVSGDIDSGGWKLILSSDTGFSGAQGESRGFFLDNTKTFSRYAIDFPTT
jgi:Ca2+-binding RTX toxin-like protein